MVIFQNDPFRNLDSALDRVWSRQKGLMGAYAMAMDAYRRGNDVWVHVDLPGVTAESIDVSLERDVLTVTAQRDFARQSEDQVYVSERHRGTFTRQMHLGNGLDPSKIEASYLDGVLSLRIPIAEQAKPRKIEVTTKPEAIEVVSAAS